MMRSLPSGPVDNDPAGDSAAAGTRLGAQRKMAMGAIVLLGLLLVLAAAIVPMKGAVIAMGELGVESRVKVIAHPQGGVISDIAVRNGQHVRRGEILMRLDDTVSETDAKLSSLSVYQLLAQRGRLEAERLGASSILFPAELTASRDPGATGAMNEERKLFVLRRQESAGLVAQLQSRIQQTTQQIAGYQAQIEALRKQQVLIGPERDGVKKLWERDLVTISRMNQLERTAVEMDGSIGALQANIAESHGRITEAREQIIQVGQTRRADAGKELAQVNAALNQQQVRSVSAGDTFERSLIRAPYDGVVDKLAFNTVGGVVRPAEPIMQIVPDRDRLIVEGAVQPSDIDQVSTGQKARVRFSAFNVTTTPEVIGKVIFVAAERTTREQSNDSYYPVRVQIDEADLAQHPDLALKQGMPAELFIETGNRSMLSYITKPLRDQFARAFRDN